MNYLWNILGVFLSLLLIDSINAQKLAASSKCVTPDNKTGRCISIRDCNQLLWLLQNKRKYPKADEFLRRSVCGTAGNNPMVCCSSNVTSDTPIVKTELLPSDICGVPDISQKIVGGEAASLGDYPWMAALGYKKPTNPGPEWICGGSLISNRYVLTAAHCLSGIKPWELFTVRLGDLDLKKNIKDGASPVNYPIERSFVHEKHSSSPLSNDIALVKLSSPVQFTNLIKPICLPVANELRRSNLENQIGYVAGWGKTSYDFSSAGSFSSHLQDVKLPILNLSICKEAYKVIPKSQIDSKNICAGYLEGKKDSCQGDSGGPLMWINPTDSKYYLIGIVSFGYKCAEPGFPGVYTKVSEYVDWIQQKMN